MFKYKDVVFSLRSSLINSLKLIEGIGISRASYILDSLGFSRLFKTIDMNYYHHGNIVLLLKSRYVLDSRLKELHLQRLEFFFAKNFVKGKRLFDGLPLSGRTHSNGASALRLKPFSEKYNDEILSRQRRIANYAKTRIKKKKR
jgi:ribosomal protein S13